MRWRNITLDQYVKVDYLHNTEHDDVDRVAHVMCVLMGKTPEEVNGWSDQKFLRKAAEVERLFKSDITKPWYQRTVIITDAKRLTFGDFVSVIHFIKMGFVANMHHIVAVLLKNKTADHQQNVSKAILKPITAIFSDLTVFMQSWESLLFAYRGLFEIEESEELDEERPNKKGATHYFMEDYGWIYSATKVAEHYRVSLNEAFELSVTEALNALAYLKSKTSYDKWLDKQ